jgi:hypothetical protein
LQTDKDASSSSLLRASKLTIEIGMTIIETMISLNPIPTMKLFPIIFINFMWYGMDVMYEQQEENGEKKVK